MPVNQAKRVETDWITNTVGNSFKLSSHWNTSSRGYSQCLIPVNCQLGTGCFYSLHSVPSELRFSFCSLLQSTKDSWSGQPIRSSLTTFVSRTPDSNMEPVTIDLKGRKFELALIPIFYRDGNIAVQAIDVKDGIAWGVLTVNVPDQDLGGDNRSAIKDYSENEAWAKQVLSTLVDRGDCKIVGTAQAGYATVPVVEWSPSAVTTA